MPLCKGDIRRKSVHARVMRPQGTPDRNRHNCHMGVKRLCIIGCVALPEISADSTADTTSWRLSFLEVPLHRGCNKDAHPFFFLLWHPLSDVWWLPTNRQRLHTNRHRLHINRHRLPTNRHRLHTNRHRLHTNRHRLPTNRHRLPTGRHHRAYWTLRVFFFFFIMAPPAPACSAEVALDTAKSNLSTALLPPMTHRPCTRAAVSTRTGRFCDILCLWGMFVPWDVLLDARLCPETVRLRHGCVTSMSRRRRHDRCRRSTSSACSMRRSER